MRSLVIYARQMVLMSQRNLGGLLG